MFFDDKFNFALSCIQAAVPGPLRDVKVYIFWYSWIGPQVHAREKLIPEQTARAAAGLPMSYKLGSRWDNVITWSNFKSETSFGFLNPKTTRDNVLDFFCKT